LDEKQISQQKREKEEGRIEGEVEAKKRTENMNKGTSSRSEVTSARKKKQHLRGLQEGYGGKRKKMLART